MKQGGKLAGWQRHPWFFGFLAVCVFSIFGVLFYSQHIAYSANATPTPLFTYQGKLLNNNRAVTTTIPMGFLIYDAITGGNLLYTASGTLSSTTTVSITPSSGIFSVTFGATNTPVNALDTSIFKNNEGLYLEVVASGTVLTPRKQLTVSPYAFNSQYLIGISATSTSSSLYIPHSDVNGNFRFTGDPQGTSVTSGLIYINPSTAAGNETLFGIGDNGTERFKVDKEGDTFVSGTLAITGSSTFAGGFVSQASSTVGGALNVTSTLSVTGAVTVSSTLSVVGAVTVSSTLGVTGLATFYNGLIANSSTITSTLTVGGNINASSTLTVANLATFYGGFQSNASSSIGSQLLVTGATTVSSSLVVTGSAIVSSTLGVTGLATFYNGLIANSSTITSTLTVGGDLRASSTLGVTSLATFYGGFVSNASSSVGAQLNVSGNLAASSTLTVGSLATFYGGFQSNASSSVGGALTVTGQSIVSSTFLVRDLATFYGGFQSNASSSVGAQLNVSGNIAASSTLTVGSLATFYGGFQSNASSSIGSILNVSGAITGSSTLSIAGATTISSTLGVTGLATFYNGLIANSSTITSTLTVGGNLSASSTLTVGSLATFYGGFQSNASSSVGSSLLVTGPTAISSTLNVSGAVINSSTLGVTGLATFYNGLIANSSTITSTLTVGGNVNASSTITVNSLATLYGGFQSNASSSVGSVLGISGRTTVSSSFHAQGAVTMSSTLGVSDLATFYSGFIANASSSIGSSLNISGNLNASSAFFASGLSNLQGGFVSNASSSISAGGLNVSYATNSSTLNANYLELGVTGPVASSTQISNSLLIVGGNTSTFRQGLFFVDTALGGNGNVSTSGTLRATGLATLQGGVISNASSSIGGTLNVSGNIAASSTLTVGSLATFYGGFQSNASSSIGSQLLVTGATTVSSSLLVTGSTIVSSTLGVTGLATFYNGLIANSSTITSTLTVGGNLSASSTLTVGSLAIFYGGFQSNASSSVGSFLSVAGNLNVSSSLLIGSDGGSNVRFIVDGSTGNIVSSGTLRLTDGASSTVISPTYIALGVTSTAFASGTFFVDGRAGGNGSVYTSGTLRVTGLSTLQGGFISNASSSIGSSLNVVGNLNASSSLFVGPGNISQGAASYFFVDGSNGNTNTSGTLAVENLSIFYGGFQSRASSSVGAQLNVIGNISASSTITVKDLATFYGGFLTASSTVTSSLNVSGALNASSTILVKDIATLYGGFIAASSSVTSSLNVSGNLNASSSLYVGNGGGATGYFFVDGTNGNTFTSGTIRVSGDVTPRLNNASDVGAFGTAFKNIFSSGTIYFQNASTTGRIEQMISSTVLRQVGFTVDDDSVNLSSLAPISTSTQLESPYDLYVVGNYAYVTTISDDSLSIIDITDPTVPREVGSTTAAYGGAHLSDARGIYVSGNYAYIAANADDALSIIDISSSTSPYEIGYLIDNNLKGQAQGLDGATDVQVSGRYAYVTSEVDAALSVIDISNPRAPREVGVYQDLALLSSGPQGLYVSGNYAYTAWPGGGLMRIIDISNPSAPTSTKGSMSLSSTNDAIFTTPYDVQVVGRYAYMVADAAGSGNDGIAVIDVSNPNSPRLAAKLTGSQNSALVGTGRLMVSGNDAYIVHPNQETNALTVVDITSSTNPFVAARLVDGTYSATALDDTTAVFVQGHYAYVTTDDDDTLTVIDTGGIDTYAANIGNLYAGSISVGDNVIVGNDLNVKGGVNIGIGGLNVEGNASFQRNITQKFDPGLMRIVSSTVSSTIPSSAFGALNGAAAVDVVGDYAYVVASTTNSTNDGSSNDSFSVVNVADPANPIIVATSSPNLGVQPNRPYDIMVAGRYAYITSDQIGGATLGKLMIVDLSYPVTGGQKLAPTGNRGNAPVYVGTVTLGGGTKPRGVYVSGRYVYVTCYGDNALRIVDVTNPGAPTVAATLTDNTNLSGAFDVYVSGNYAYVTAQAGGTVTVVDVSDPLLPTVVGVTGTGASTYLQGPNRLTVSGNYAYVAVGRRGSSIVDGLTIIDISSSTNPTLVTSTRSSTLMPGAFGVEVAGDYAYVTSYGDSSTSATSTLTVIDISSSTAPVILGSLKATPQNYFSGLTGIKVYKNFAYITAEQSNALAIVELPHIRGPLANVGKLFATNVDTSQNISVGNDLIVRNSITAGNGGIFSGGPVAINGGTSSTVPILAVTGSASSTGSVARFTGNSSSTVLFVSSNGSSTVALFNQAVGHGLYLSFGTGPVGGTQQGSIALATDGTTVSYNAFTGSHYTWIDGVAIQLGELAVLTGNNKHIDNNASSETIYGIRESARANDSQILGAYLGLEDANSPNGNHLVAAVGNGDMWIADTGENIGQGDYLMSSDVPGHAMKDPGTYPVAYLIARAGESVDWSTVSSTVEGTAIKHKKISVFFENFTRTNLQNALSVDSDGETITIGSSTNPYALNLTGAVKFAADGLFTSNIAKGADAHAFTFDALNLDENASDQYLVSLRGNGQPKFSVAANGDVHTVGNIYAQSLIAGSPGTPGDLAERVDIRVNEIVEPGDVMIVDLDSTDAYQKSTTTYQQAVAGVISTQPTIIVGNGKTEHTADMAVTGRVPVKVSAENGAILRGDLLVTAGIPGYAMKYDSNKDTDLKMVGVIGIALESLESGNGKIMALVRTGWVHSRNETIKSLQKDLLQVAAATGVDLNHDTDELTVKQTDTDHIVFATDQDVNLNAHYILNVAGIFGSGEKWQIDTEGRFVTKIATTEGEKSLYSIQSENLEYIFSGSDALDAGTKRIDFTTTTREIIDPTKPIKVSITLTSEGAGVYVSTKDVSGFTVKELNSGTSSSTFDWVVIATRRLGNEQGSGISEQPAEEPTEPASEPIAVSEEPPVGSPSPSEPTSSTVSEPTLPTPTPEVTPEVVSEPANEPIQETTTTGGEVATSVGQ